MSIHCVWSSRETNINIVTHKKRKKIDECVQIFSNFSNTYDILFAFFGIYMRLWFKAVIIVVKYFNFSFGVFINMQTRYRLPS